MSTRYEIFTGNFGSGKTELSLNVALHSAAAGLRTALVDADIVNPYFCSATQRERLEAAGVRVIAPAYAGTGVDLPALPAEFVRVFSGEFDRVIIDVGGDPTGARVLGRYHRELDRVRDRLRCNLVVNALRPMTTIATDVVAMCEQIIDRARLRVDCLINNTNLAEETAAEHLLHGQRLLEEVGSRLGLPIRWITGTREVLRAFAALAPEAERQGALYQTVVYMRPDWLRRTG